MKHKVAFSILFLLVFALLYSCGDSKKSKKYNLPIEELVIHTTSGNVSVNSELAIKKDERNWGYMEREVIPDGTGMLFVFEIDDHLRFWMKNTPHPLSIAYIGSDGIIYDILDMKPYSTAGVESSRAVRFALEVPQGWFEKVNVQVGDRVSRKDGSKLTTIK